MKYYAQFFGLSAIDKSKIIEACGDRAVIILDGRCNRQWMLETAARECKKRGFVAWQLHSGDFRQSQKISPIIEIDKVQA